MKTILQNPEELSDKLNGQRRWKSLEVVVFPEKNPEMRTDKLVDKIHSTL